MKLQISDNQHGFVILVTTIVVTLIGVALIGALILFGIAQARSSFAAQSSLYARALASACAEEALQQIRDSTPFTGSASLTLSTGTCNYTVTNLGGQNREIEAYGTVGTIVRKVNLFIDTINPDINVTSWQEVADF